MNIDHVVSNPAVTTLSLYAQAARMVLMRVEALRPSEHHNPQRVLSLRRSIERDGVWTQPLWVEALDGIIMDGHHRYEVARAMDLVRIPCLMLSYDDIGLSVVTWDGNVSVQPTRILQAARSGDLLPYKTTKHTLNWSVPPITVDLSELR